jgi:hypothetical protein
MQNIKKYQNILLSMGILGPVKSPHDRLLPPSLFLLEHHSEINI